MEDTNNPLIIKNKIVSIIRTKGPSLPIHIARETGLNTLLASAFLSELVSMKALKISTLKIGGSPLYYLSGQEHQLENFANYLPQKEKEAFFLLKEKKLLDERELEPAIRVALRNLKDFAFPLVLNYEGKKLIFWRFHSLKVEEAKEIIKKIMSKPATTPSKNTKPQEEEIKEGKKKVEPISKPKTEKEKPLITLKKPKRKKPKEKSEFVKKVEAFLEAQDLELIEELEIKKREYHAIIRINSDLGKMRFLLVAKDKKSITENDLTLALQKSQSLKMPLLMIITGKLNKKAEKFAEEYSLLIKFKNLNNTQQQ